ncbi:hypothetical protein R3I94_013275 [Phoxinus phoxinus]|jgi:hypothetical protein
MTLN